MKALVIDEPWIELILAGKKTWEMRAKLWKFRGPLALIRKGSGHVVGTAIMTDCRPPLLDLAAYAAAELQHCIPPKLQAGAFAEGWRTPWVLAEARPLAKAVPYKHRKGWMSQFDLDATIAAQVQANAQ